MSFEEVLALFNQKYVNDETHIWQFIYSGYPVIEIEFFNPNAENIEMVTAATFFSHQDFIEHLKSDNCQKSNHRQHLYERLYAFEEALQNV